MQLALLEILRCPECRRRLTLQHHTGRDQAGDIIQGVLECNEGHSYPIVRSIPRLLPAAAQEHAHSFPLGPQSDDGYGLREVKPYDVRTRHHFSHEWSFHRPGDRTWGMELEDRVECFFMQPLLLEPSDLIGRRIIDAGCGNGSQTVAYSAFGAEVIGIDISAGVELGEQFRHVYPNGSPTNVHFLQADLQQPPLAEECADIIHSAGVLHHTPDTKRTFDSLVPLLKKGGLMYVWLYKHEPVVTPVVTALRGFTTRIPAHLMINVARVAAPLFMLFTRCVDALRIRKYPRLTRREAALALLDIFGSPHAHSHEPSEVEQWFGSHGFVDVRVVNEGRRGFGVCGRKGTAPHISDRKEANLGFEPAR